MRALHQITLPTLVAIGGVAATVPIPSHAQQRYPSKPIRIVVPFTPGGTSDVLARMIGAKVGEGFGQPVVIETRTGAGGTIGANIVAKATPDGHTLLISSAAFTITAAMNPNLPYDPLKDFVGITRLGYSTTALITNPSLGAKTVKDLITLAQANRATSYSAMPGWVAPRI